MPRIELAPPMNNGKVQIFYSNRIEFLVQLLRAHLFPPEESPSIFKKRILTCPSKSVREYLSQTLAAEDKVLAGVDFLYINQAISRLFDCNSPFPNQVDLSLAIKKIIQTKKGKNFPLWEGVFSQIGDKSEKKEDALSLVLAKLFFQYPFQIPNTLLEWETLALPENFQQEIWKEIFYEDSPFFNPLSLIKQEECAPHQTEWHLFGFSAFSPFHMEIFKKLEGIIPIYHYQLSPCQVFWGDILSDREALWLNSFFKKRGINQEELNELDLLLRDKNPLLANFGKLGKEATKQLECFDSYTSFIYGAPKTLLIDARYQNLVAAPTLEEKCDEKLTALSLLQTELLFLLPPPETPFSLEDSSIEIHLAQNRSREVEILKDNILRTFSENPELKPHEICVMAPDINLYAPQIEAVFSRTDFPLEFQLIDIKSSSQGTFSESLIEAFLLLLEVGEKSFEAPQVLELFEHPAFKRKVRWNQEDLSQIEKWITLTNTHWGFDAQERNRLLHERGLSEKVADPSSAGTWLHSLKQLALGLILAPENSQTSSFSAAPFEEIEISDASLLNSLLKTLYNLYHAFKDLESVPLASSSWGVQMEKLMENFLEGDSKDERQREERQILLAFFNKLKKTPVKDTTFSFHLIHRLLLQDLEEASVGFKENNLSAIKVCSLLPMRTLPIKALFLLGMEKESFPRKEILPFYSLLKEASEAKQLPKRQDYDRYLFLEALLSARKKLVISLQGAPSEKGEPPAASPPVQELISYLDQLTSYDNTLFSKKRIFRHPFSSFDPRYFNGSFPPSFHLLSRRLAQLNIKIENKLTPSFFSSPLNKEHSFNLRQDKLEKIVPIQNLVKCLKTPLKIYLENALSIFSLRESKALSADEPFSFDPLEHHIFIKEAFFSGLEEKVEKSKKEGSFPLGIFSNALENLLKKKMDAVKQKSEDLKLPLEDVQTFELTLTENKPVEALPGYLLVPSISLEVEEVGEVKIIGKIPSVVKDGLLLFSKEDKTKWLFNYPYLILGRLLEENFGVSGPTTLHFLQDSKKKRPSTSIVDPQKTLRSILKFYFHSIQNPCPLHGNWFLGLEEKGEKQLQEKFNQLFDPFQSKYYEDYLPFFSSHYLPSPENVLDEWGPLLFPILKDFETLYKPEGK